MKMLKKTLLCAATVVAATSLSAGTVFAQAAQAAPDAATIRAEIDKAIDTMRKDARAGKAEILGKTMALDSTQAAAFWPIYKQYEAELQTLNNERVAIIQDLAEHYDTLNDAKAKGLVDRQMAYEEKRVALAKKYADEMMKVLPAKTVARFLQVDSRLNKLADLAVANEIPLVQ
jgi:hypothetical protein